LDFFIKSYIYTKPSPGAEPYLLRIKSVLSPVFQKAALRRTNE